jgi:hypothetical protein
MIDWLVTFIVVMGLVGVTVAVTSRQPRPMRPLVWLALAEYLACAIYQYSIGADANGYRETGDYFAHLLDNSFTWTAGEMLNVLFQRPSAFDDLVGGTANSGSMCAIAGFILFFVRHSGYAAQALVAGLSMFGALGIYTAFREAHPELAPRRLFVATVLFPSIAFWTAALHKESFCLMGIGLLLCGWRALLALRLRAVPYVTFGIMLIVLIRTPALPPILLGLVLHFVVGRVQRARGVEATLVAPIYLGLGLGVLVVGMLLVTRIAPDLALDRLGESVALHQSLWARGTIGGSSFDVDAEVQRSVGQQFLAAPYGLVNALFRPQLFDVTNASMTVSAVEMTAITWLMIRAVRVHGIRKLISRVQSSPVLIMCTVITIVGCTFIGLTTRNFGSMARYRVPFLPFYGVLLATITEKVRAPARPQKAPLAMQRPVRPVRRPKPIGPGTRAPAR